MNLKQLNLIKSIFGFVLLTFNATPSLAETPVYSFAVVPQFKPMQLHQDWDPVLERISRETGVKLKLTIAPSIPKSAAELNKAVPDFTYTDPYQAFTAMKGHGYLPMLRSTKPLNGILVVRKDSEIKKIQDLDGKIIGFPAPNSFGASLYLRALLSAEKIKFTPRYLNNHNLVYKHVALGHVAAGGSVTSALNEETPEMRAQLTVLYQTPDVAPHPIIAHPRVPANIRKSVVASLLGMQQDSEGRNMLKEIRMPNLIEADFQKDYAPLEKLNIQQFIVTDAE
jgi:phosphonate transport system substrate-binding protein